MRPHFNVQIIELHYAKEREFTEFKEKVKANKEACNKILQEFH